MRNRESGIGPASRGVIALAVVISWLALASSGAVAMAVEPLEATTTKPSSPEANLEFAGNEAQSPPGSALEVATAATVAQAKALSTPLGPLPALMSHHSPSAALYELLARHHAVPTDAQAQAFAELDALATPLRQSLTRVLDAFLASEDATAAAFAAADPTEMGGGIDPSGGIHTNIDLAPIFSARLALLDASAALQEAVAEHGLGRSRSASVGGATTASASCGEPAGAEPGVVAIDDEGKANCYTGDYRLVVDMGGRDTYNNNAGGTAGGTSLTPAPLGWPLGYWGYHAALVDVGSQDDRYVSGRVGSNGGGTFGTGFLYDDGGNETYTGGAVASNGGGGEGGGYAGTGFLYDGWGDDTYTAGGVATNGGGYFGAGMLIDGAGNDSYKATPGSWGTNGGGGGGAGSLIDLGQGTDSYRTGGTLLNRPYVRYESGNGRAFGYGLLLDAAGSGDTYTTIDNTTNAATTDVDDSEVPKGTGAQIDQCRSGAGVNLDQAGVQYDPDYDAAQLCAAVTSAVASVSIDDVTLAEKDSGTTTATFTVSLSQQWPLPVEVDYASSDGTASAGSDYTAVSGTLAFAAYQTSRTISVTVTGDTLTEDNEAFYVVLRQVRGATIAKGRGQGTILNDDLPAVRVNDISLSEGDSGTKAFNFTVTLSVPTTKVVSLNYATADGPTIGGATAPGDYTSTNGTMSFAPGTTTATISVLVKGDTVVEPNEWFFVNILGVTNATVAKAQGKATIFNDDQ